MGRRQILNGFQLNDQFILNQEISHKVPDQNAVIKNTQGFFRFKSDAAFVSS